MWKNSFVYGPSVFRFSLFTFLSTITLFCIWLGVLVHHVNKQREAVEWVKRFGGSVTYCHEWDEVTGSLIEDAEPPGPVWLRRIVGDEFFESICEVNFQENWGVIHTIDSTGSPCVEVVISTQPIDDLTPLANLTQLRRLWIGNATPVRDLSPLSGLRHLQTLHLVRPRIESLAALQHLSSLEDLSVIFGPLTDISCLANLTNLEVLDLSYTEVNEISALADLAKLKRLTLIGTKATDLRALANLQRLKHLELSFSEVDDISPLADLQNLSWLALDHTKVNDLSPLTRMPKLSYANVNETLVTDEEVENTTNQSPGLYVFWK